jgi:nanoRNase/pAp phosphatase (c-di-AMP/oligoRNAs hydrolase)
MTISEKFDYVKSRANGETVAILVAQVDPDALGSAFGLQYLFKKLGVSSDIYYVGAVSHPQNRAITNYFNLLNQMKKIDEFNHDSMYCLVDSQETKDSRLKIELNPHNLLLVIDHHRGDQNKLFADCKSEKGEVVLMIEEVGSASTLVTELYQELKIEYEEDAKSVFNLLALGIYTDTKDLVSATERDYKAFTYLRGYLDPIDISRFINYSLPSSFFKNWHSAIQTFEQHGSKAIASLGFISSKDRDNLSSIADLLLRREGVDFVAVWAIINDSVAISFRNDNLSTPLDGFVREKFDNMGGAKLTSDGKGEGGANIPLNMQFWFGEENKDPVLEIVSNRLGQLIFSE